MPIRGPRKLYKIDAIKVGEGPGATGGRSIIVKMKEPIGDWLGMFPLPWNAPELIGTFGGTGPNAGYKYIRRLGGFRQSSFKIVSKTEFQIQELLKQPDGVYSLSVRNFKSISIGFPKGVSVHEFVYWIGTTNKVSQISHIVTPSGVGFSFGPVTN